MCCCTLLKNNLYYIPKRMSGVKVDTKSAGLHSARYLLFRAMRAFITATNVLCINDKQQRMIEVRRRWGGSSACRGMSASWSKPDGTAEPVC